MEIILPEIKTTFHNLWDEGQSHEAYHADKSAVGSTSLKKILTSPAHFMANLKEPEEDTDAFRFGRAVHQAVLEPDAFRKSVRVHPKWDLRTTVGKAAKKEFDSDLPPGATVVSEEEMADITGMAESIMRHKDAVGLLAGARAEISGYFRDEETGIICKIRPDLLHTDLTALTDLKTVRDCSAKAFSKQVVDLRYDFQTAFYRKGAKAISGKYPEVSAWIAIEKKYPWDVAVWWPDDETIAKGEREVRVALKRLKSCIEKNEWPGSQPDGGAPLSLPAYAFYNEVME